MSRSRSVNSLVSEIQRELCQLVTSVTHGLVPSKKTPLNTRVGSEHSLLDPPGKSKVPHDWREQVLRHIEAKKKLEKVIKHEFFICLFMNLLIFL